MLNYDLLKQPWNWFVVGFTFLLVLAVAHLFLRNTVSNGE